jgi:flavin-dependent dehydrogenase
MRAVIVGAGIAGLSAGIALRESGIETLLLDAAPGLTLKGDGEFLSHEALPLLQRWGIKPQNQIGQVKFHAGERSFLFDLPTPCYTTPRLQLEQQLLLLFERSGGVALFDHGVKAMTPGPPFRLELLKGETMMADHLLLASGRFQGKPPAESAPYIGRKNYFGRNVDKLHMVIGKGFYCGIAPLAEGRAVVSALLRRNSTLPSLDAIVGDAPTLLPEWIEAPIGAFGVKRWPAWPDSYAIGDAAATIPPIAGEGMAMALSSGLLAAEHLIRGQWGSFRSAWQRSYRKRLRLALIAHHFLLHTTQGVSTIAVVNRFPALWRALFNAMRGN